MIPMKMITVVVLLAAVVTIGAAGATRFAKGGGFRNLKVLPKDISSKDLQDIMADDFEDGLGVSCGFCHAGAPGGHGLDFASDAKPEKSIARAMMRLTLALNKRYFRVRKPMIGSEALAVTCSTCHRGQPFPDDGG